MKIRFFWFIWLPILSLAMSGCGQMISAAESKNSAIATQTATAAEGSVAPLVSPSLSDGENIFAQSCSSCHSENSQGGFAQISNDWLQATTPKEAYDLITLGMVDAGMPAFSDLPSRDRWDVIAYLMTANFPESEKRSASLIYQNICLSCHGNEGQGDGTQAIARDLAMSDWQAQALLPNLSDQDIFSIIRDGKGTSMNAFAVMLSESQTKALTKIVRLLSIQEELGLSTQAGIGQEIDSSDILGQSQGFFAIDGNVVNVSGGDAKITSDANLKIIADGQVIKKMNTPVLTNGSFRFILVPYSPEWSYVVTVSHNGMSFSSDVIYGQDTASAETTHLLLQVYDSTTDISVLRGEQTHIMLEFTGENLVNVVEYVMISNHSSYVVTPVDDETPLLMFTLPKNAQNLDLSNSTNPTNLKVIENGFGDWQSIEPGSAHQVVFTYQIPFNGDDALLFSFPVTATSVLVMVQDVSNSITCKGPQHLTQRNEASGTLDIFSAVNISAGDQLALYCYNKEQLIPQIASAVTLFFALMIVLMIFLSKRKQNQLVQREQRQQRKNQILDAIIVLDDSYKAGEIAREAYQEKRAELVRKLEEEK